MKCPICGEKLKNIQFNDEWCCDNLDCPANEGSMAYAEFYGSTQKEIDADITPSMKKHRKGHN